MKKIVSLLAALVLSFTMLPVSAVPAATVPEKAPAVFTADTVQATADSDVEVSLKLEGSYSTNVLTVYINFDNTKLTAVSMTLGPVAEAFAQGEGFCVDNVIAKEGETDLIANIEGRAGITAIIPREYVTLNGTVFTVKFHTAAGLATGESIPITVDVVSFAGVDLNNVSTPIAHETTDGAVNIDNHETFTVTWKNWDGEILATDEVEHDQLPEYKGETPVRPDDDNGYTYTFTGWDPQVVPVTANAVYTAQFNGELKTYTVTWKNWDGEILATDTVTHGNTPEYTGATPEKEADEQHTYTFDGWDPEVVPATADAVYTAKFKEELKTFTVTFIDGLTNDPIATVTVQYGGDATPPEAPKHGGYIFCGWEGSYTNVTANVTVTARYGLLGDVDGDGAVTPVDALLALRMAMEIIETPDEIFVIDVDGDGAVGPIDALLILRYAMEIITEFPVE